MKANPAQVATLDLRDIHEPAPPSPWPPAPGWWLLAALVLALLIWLGLLGWRAWRRQRLRQRVLRELAALPATDDCAALIAGVSALLKRVALRQFARDQVAELTGTAWLEFLDQTGGKGQFTQGPGQALKQGPYAPDPDCDAPALRALARTWLTKNL
ncbi:hypothetical protein Thiowin_04482 [Thiorhodovibrio winogradskyi]|uniref:DUF4381 domain-containing protein n=1 Tax=Thiorhodovibrio winogradskyi TaxID=77007 RepID=A0ABZ0SG49_9GAMM|nr:DUF4381 domain-containing protein [Thiorhodovibrio winogradskyi]